MEISHTKFRPNRIKRLQQTFFTLVPKVCSVKGTPIHVQAWTGPEGNKRMRFPDFKTVDTKRC
jgi:hypothetical protein